MYFPSEVENELLVITNRVETIGDGRGGLCARELQSAQTRVASINGRCGTYETFSRLDGLR